MSLRVHLYLKHPHAMHPYSVSHYVPNVVAGFRKHGIVPVICPAKQVRSCGECDLAVVWGMQYFADASKVSRRVLVVERGYVGDRSRWTSMGFDGLNGFADFRNKGMPGDRWEKYFAQYMQPWRKESSGEYVLIAGQKPGDASLRGLDTENWCYEMEQHLVFNGHDARIRWHPKGNAVKMLKHKASLYEQLSKAKWLVTFNSNSAVDAVLAGVPAVTMDRGAMAWAVTNHNPVAPPSMPDRTQWAYDIAYAQWSLDEIATGVTWAHLAPGMDQ